ncbi:hypothetical protein A3Q56_06550 [Intoshia linei]|uniref:BHLH domain-containing protein n=1 Tax=Intoshia linei TaxID=1819745 RepID=A0A177AX08_9BILA|nr:hypothetical protein A3Q56_06550 [Intoshia linei]
MDRIQSRTKLDKDNHRRRANGHERRRMRNLNKYISFFQRHIPEEFFPEMGRRTKVNTLRAVTYYIEYLNKITQNINSDSGNVSQFQQKPKKIQVSNYQTPFHFIDENIHISQPPFDIENVYSKTLADITGYQPTDYFPVIPNYSLCSSKEPKSNQALINRKFDPIWPKFKSALPTESYSFDIDDSSSSFESIIPEISIPNCNTQVPFFPYMIKSHI